MPGLALRCERGLADLKRIAPQVVAVQAACFVIRVPCYQAAVARLRGP
jgi:hypothetical protein